MDGRFVGHDGGIVDEGSIDESEWISARDTREDADDQDDCVDGEMVLSKGDFALLQAFHRLVPLPALRSKILRVVCDDDLQVVEEERSDAEAVGHVPEKDPELSISMKPSITSSVVTATTAKHSPLTRRLSSKTSTTSALVKPRREIDLSAQTPRLKRLTASGDDRVG